MGIKKIICDLCGVYLKAYQPYCFLCHEVGDQLFEQPVMQPLQKARYVTPSRRVNTGPVTAKVAEAVYQILRQQKLDGKQHE